MGLSWTGATVRPFRIVAACAERARARGFCRVLKTNERRCRRKKLWLDADAATLPTSFRLMAVESPPQKGLCRAFLNITNHFIFFFSQPCFGTEKWWRYRRDFGEGICMRIVSCNCFPHTHTKGPGAARGGLLCRVVITSRRHQPHNAASNWYHRRCGRRSKHGLPASSLSNQQLRC